MPLLVQAHSETIATMEYICDAGKLASWILLNARSANMQGCHRIPSASSLLILAVLHWREFSPNNVLGHVSNCFSQKSNSTHASSCCGRATISLNCTVHSLAVPTESIVKIVCGVHMLRRWKHKACSHRCFCFQTVFKFICHTGSAEHRRQLSNFPKPKPSWGTADDIRIASTIPCAADTLKPRKHGTRLASYHCWSKKTIVLIIEQETPWTSALVFRRDLFCCYIQ